MVALVERFQEELKNIAETGQCLENTIWFPKVTAKSCVQLLNSNLFLYLRARDSYVIYLQAIV